METLQCLNRYIELFEAQKQPYAMQGTTLYYQSLGVVRTWGPVIAAYPLTRQQGLSLCRRIRGRFVISTHGFTQAPTQNWYAVICDKFRRLEEMKAKNRSEVNRGLRNCEVRQVDAEYIACHGYEVYRAAINSYSSYYTLVQTEADFRQEHQACHSFGDIVHYWGVFCKDRLIAYAQNMLFDGVEANYWTVKLHPAFLSAYPSYALFHKMNEFYLQTQGFQYVNDGWRSLLHETQVQDFLIRKFGFRKAYTPMSVVYSPVTSLVTRLCYPWRDLARKIDLRLAGLCQLEAIRRGKDTDADMQSEPVADRSDKNQTSTDVPGHECNDEAEAEPKDSR